MRKFLEDMDQAAPWFASLGDINLPCWEKLGKDLEAVKEQGTLRPGTLPLWRLVRTCLKEGKCVEVLKEGRRALSAYQDSMSESESKGKGGPKRKETKESDNSSQKGEKELQSSATPEKKSIYPFLDEFANFSIDRSSDEEDRLDEEEEQDLEEAAAQYVRERYSPEYTKPPPYDSCHRPTAPSAASASFIKHSTWNKLASAYPVFQDPNTGQRYHEPIGYKQLKDLAEATQTYGVSASFTLGLVECLGQSAMTPADWMSTMKACVSLGQYLDFKSIYTDLAIAQACTNAANGNATWTVDMLLGQGQWINNQTVFPIQVYQQINEMAIRAWKSLPNRGQVSGKLTKVIQGPTEPFSDFIARMLEAAGRIFGDADQSMPLIEQLIFKQCTKDCQRAITP